MFASKRNLDAATFAQQPTQTRPHQDKNHNSDAVSTLLPKPSANRRAPSLLSDTLIAFSSTASSPATKRLPPPPLQRTWSKGRPPPTATPRTPRSSAGPHSGLTTVPNNASGKDKNQTLRRESRHRKSRKRRREDHDESLQIRRATRSAKMTNKHTSSRRKQLSTAASSKGQRDGRRDGRMQGQSRQTPSCCLCDIDLASLPRRQCIDCPHIHFCIPCSITARDIHPGHTLQFRRPEETACEPGSQTIFEVIDDSENPFSGSEDARHRQDNSKIPSHVDIHEHTATSTPGVQCYKCKTKLLEPGHKCQSCPGTHFCYSCHKSHHHTLTAATVPRHATPGSDSTGENGGSGEITTHKDDQSKQSALTIRRTAETNRDANAVALARMTQAMTQAIDGMIALRSAAEQLLRSGNHNTQTTKSGALNALGATSTVAHSLLDFPIDFSTLNSNNKDGDGDGDGGDNDNADSDSDGVPQKTVRLHKRWTDKDRRRLRELKRQGLSFTEIGITLGRTEGAVSQEWRKQSM